MNANNPRTEKTTNYDIMVALKQKGNSHMSQYQISLKDYCLPTGEQFAVAICGYNGKVRHLIIEKDPLRNWLVRHIDVDGQTCSCAQHCISLDCPLNHTEKEHLMHMLGMYKDEPVDEATAKLWGKNTSLEILIEMARRISESLALESLNTPADNSAVDEP
jgi:hypothetical protein